MRRRSIIGIIALSLAVGGGGGYLLRAQKTDGSLVLSLQDAVQEEYLASQDTFSRVRNTRNALEALSTRYGMEIMDALLAQGHLARGSEAERAQARQVLERIINAAETAAHEFEGTVQQMQVTESLLFALQRAERFNRWTEVYLKAVHEYPTHPLVARRANEAIRNGKLTGQQARVAEALSHVTAFEPALAGRAEIEAALLAAGPYFSQMEFPCVGADPGDPEKRGLEN